MTPTHAHTATLGTLLVLAAGAALWALSGAFLFDHLGAAVGLAVTVWGGSVLVFGVLVAIDERPAKLACAGPVALPLASRPRRPVAA